MSKKEQSKVWFITGISRGFGRELASAALERGDVVIGTSRIGKSDIVAAPERFYVFALDVTHPKDVISVVTQAWQIRGQVDVVVNNAGFGVLGAVEEVEEKQARNVFETNFFGLLSAPRRPCPFYARKQAATSSTSLLSEDLLGLLATACTTQASSQSKVSQRHLLPN